MRRTLAAMLLTAVLFLLMVQLALGDRGMVPVTPGVSVYEPGQKAIIGWNGREEILILSTDVKASQRTLVLEMLPLPSAPTRVELASFAAFEEVQSLIWRHVPKALRGYGKGVVEGVEVVFHERIGAHDVTVVEAGDLSEFMGWIADFLGENGLQPEVSLKEFEPVLRDYMARGFRHYVLDLVEVSPKENSVEPILYQFETRFLYYPLVITSPLKGETRITLFLLTSGRVEGGFYPLTKACYVGLNRREPIEFWLSNGEISKIDLRLGRLFGDGGAWLTVLTYEGSPGDLTSDLMITETSITPSTPLVEVRVELATPTYLLAVFTVLGMACTLAGAGLTYLILRRTWRRG